MDKNQLKQIEADSMENWKAVFVKFAGLGFGVALVGAIISGSYRYIHSLPRPWDEQAIKPSYDGLTFFPGDTAAVNFNIILHNNTGHDYQLTFQSEDLFLVLPSGKGLYQPQNAPDLLMQEIDFIGPSYIPANESVTATVEIRYKAKQGDINSNKNSSPIIQNPTMPDGERTYLRDRLKFISGIVLIDRSEHYKIRISDEGWSKIDFQSWKKI